jgi:hypothetical protein
MNILLATAMVCFSSAYKQTPVIYEVTASNTIVEYDEWGGAHNRTTFYKENYERPMLAWERFDDWVSLEYNRVWIQEKRQMHIGWQKYRLLEAWEPNGPRVVKIPK